MSRDRWYCVVTARGEWTEPVCSGRMVHVTASIEELTGDTADQIRRAFEALDRQGWSSEFDDATLAISVTWHRDDVAA